MLQKGRSEEARKSLKDLIDSELLQTIDNNVRKGYSALSATSIRQFRVDGIKYPGRLTVIVYHILLSTNPQQSEVAARGTPVRRLQYLVYMNYASILEESAENISALQYYLKVT